MEYLDDATLKHRIGGRPMELETPLESRLRTRWMRHTRKESCTVTSNRGIYQEKAA
jgi:hypothetical protein